MRKELKTILFANRLVFICVMCESKNVRKRKSSVQLWGVLVTWTCKLKSD